MAPVYLPPKNYAPPDRIKLIAEGWDISDMVAALRDYPDLWNRNSLRTTAPTSPHHGTSDIWARFAADVQQGGDPHLSVWWPAADVLPIRRMAREVMALVGGEQLGGVLITRIPPGGMVLPHADPGWHARYYDKVAVQIAAAPGQVFCFEGQTLEAEPGDGYWFDNSEVHWVTNPTERERITAIFCVRLDRSPQ